MRQREIEKSIFKGKYVDPIIYDSIIQWSTFEVFCIKQYASCIVQVLQVFTFINDVWE